MFILTRENPDPLENARRLNQWFLVDDESRFEYFWDFLWESTTLSLWVGIIHGIIPTTEYK